MSKIIELLRSLDKKLILILCMFCIISITAIYSSQQTGTSMEAQTLHFSKVGTI